MTIREEVVKEIRSRGWTPTLDVGMSYVEQAIDLTINKIIREIQGIEVKSTDEHTEVALNSLKENIEREINKDYTFTKSEEKE